VTAVILSREGDVATLALNRPARGNALGPELVQALEEGFDAALAGNARLIVLRGEGRHFCTGFDLTDLEALSDGDLLLRVVRIEQLLQRIHAAPVTTLAIATGRTFGAGADLFAACDHRIAVEGASFAFPGPAFGGTGRARSCSRGRRSPPRRRWRPALPPRCCRRRRSRPGWRASLPPRRGSTR
jgi:enoyl-CoA hydratase/carnithine racemase